MSMGLGLTQFDTRKQRGQVGPLGMIFVFAFALLGAGLILVFVGGQLSASEATLNDQRAENALTQFDSKAALVALGNTDSQTVSLPTANGNRYGVEDGGWLRIATVDGAGNTTILLNESLGSVTYGDGEATYGYQGGGVWRASAAGGRMISPPEFHYRNTTLTFPVLSVDGSDTLSGDVTISGNGTTEPDSITGRINPITDEKIEITVQSRFYRGWGDYFEERAQSNVRYNETRSTVNITLVPPPEPVDIDSGVISSNDLDIKSGAAGVTGDISLGGTTDDESSVTGTVEENVVANRNLTAATTEIDDAQSRLSNRSAPASNTTVDAGSYYVSDDDIFRSETTFNTSGGDIELFVDGNVEADGGGGNSGGNNNGGGSSTSSCTPGSSNLNVTGDGNVTVYVDGEFHMNGQTVWGNCAQVDSLLIYSEDVSRIAELHGVLYTDAISIKGKGGRKGLVGALVSTADTVSLGGNAQITYDDSLGTRTIQEVETEYAGISYLHVTHNEIKVTD